MERKEVNNLMSDLEKIVISWAKAHRTGLIIGGIFGFSLTAAYLISRVKILNCLSHQNQ